MLVPPHPARLVAPPPPPRAGRGRDTVIEVRPLSLRSNFSWSLVGNVVYTGCQWGMLMALTRLGSPEMLGQFALGLAVTTPVLSFANLKARGVQASDARREYHFSEYFFLVLFMTALALLVVGGVVFGAGYRAETGLVVLVVAVGKAFDVLADVFFGSYQQDEQMDRIARALVANGFLSLAALAAGVYVTGSIVCGAAGWALAKLLTLAVFNLPDAPRLFRAPRNAEFRMKNVEINRANPRRQTIPLLSTFFILNSAFSRRLLALATLTLPVCIAALLLSLNANVPRYFIERYLGERELGLFAAMAYLLLPGTSIIIAALGQSASPRLAKYYSAGDRRAFRALLLKLVAVCALGGALAVLAVLAAGRQILALLYTPEYAEHADVFLWLTLEAGVGFVSSVLAYGLTAARYFRAQLPLSVATLSVMTLACTLLLSEHGLFGAALAALIAGLFHLAGSTALVLHALHNLRAPGGRS